MYDNIYDEITETLLNSRNKETAKRNGFDVCGYLLYLLTKFPEWNNTPTDEQIDSVMPWSSELPEYCRQMYSEIQ